LLTRKLEGGVLIPHTFLILRHIANLFYIPSGIVFSSIEKMVL
jgi:hypothetical protein